MVKEEVNGDVVHAVALGERSRLTCQPAHTLAQGTVEALDVVGRPSRLALF